MCALSIAPMWNSSKMLDCASPSRRHSLFWAVYWLAGLAGALADASLSELPITFGPANAAAGGSVGRWGALSACGVRAPGYAGSAAHLEMC